MTVQLDGVWGSYEWRGWATLVDVVVAPDGRTVWTADQGGWLAQWDAITGVPLRRLPLGEPASVPVAAAITPDGARMLVSRAAGTLAAYDLATGARLWHAVGVNPGSPMVPAIDRIAISADGTLAITAAPGEGSPALHVWDVATGAARKLAGGARSLALLPDGTALVNGRRVIDLAAGATVFEIPGPPRATIGTCSADGATIVTGNEDGELWCWETATLRAPDAKPIWQGKNVNVWGDKNPIKQIRVLRDSVFTASTLSHQTWSRANGRRIADLPFQGTWRVSHAPDATRAYGIGLQQRRLRHLDLIRAGEVRPSWEHEQTVTAIAISADGTLAATGGADNTIRTWDLATGRPRGVIATGEVRALVLSPDGRRLVEVHMFGGGVHDIATGATQLRWSAFGLKLRGFVDVAVTPDGGAAILVDEDGTVLRWDLAADREVWRRARAGGKRVAIMAGDRLAVTTTRCEVALWDAATGEPDAVHPIPDRLKTQPQIVLDGHRVLAIQTGTGLVERALTTGEIVRAFPGTETADGVLVRSPDGRLAAIATAAGVQVWHVASAVLVGSADLSEQLDAASCMAFTPDGGRLLVGTMRGIVLRYAISE